MKKNSLIEIYKSTSTVFTLKDIALLSGQDNENALKSKMNYYIKRGGIKSVRKGIYVKDNYNRFELANKIYTPSYISLETVLSQENIISQYYETIFIVSYLSREIKSLNLRYRKIKNTILYHPMGLIKNPNYTIASKERAFLDALYIYGTYFFDNIFLLDQTKIFTLIEEVYKIQKMEKKAKELFKNA